MVHLAAPLGLLALGALAVPIVLHLVRRPPQTVHVGSLRFLEAARRPIRSFRWHRWLLLTLRCAVLAALACSLAGIAWQPAAPAPARWLLLLPGATLDAAAQASWDRLRAAGFQPRWLAPGFPRRDAAPPSAAATSDGWSLLREADLALPANSRAHVFGPTAADTFRGPRPTLRHLEVTWHAAAAAAPAHAPAVAPPRVALIAAANRADDARYLRAVFTALGTPLGEAASADWIFLLGAAPLPPAAAARVSAGARLVTDAPDSAPVRPVIRTLGVVDPPVRLHQRVDLRDGAPVLRDSTGEPWLVETRSDQGRRWQFASRFHPAWTDWPLTPAWPVWWRSQFALMPDAAPPIAPAQAAPAFARTETSGPRPAAAWDRIDLRPWAWLVAALLLFAERWLSARADPPKAAA